MNRVENPNTHTVTLTGYLGKDPDARDTRVRTTTRTATRTERFVFEYQGRRLRDADDRLEDHVEYELTTTPRTFAVLSLATHRWHRGRRTTTWHRVVAWNVDRQHFGVFRLKKGDRVEITGRPSTFVTEDGREIEQIELVHFRLRRRKPPTETPRLPARATAGTVDRRNGRCFRSRDGRMIPLVGPARVRR